MCIRDSTDTDTNGNDTNGNGNGNGKKPRWVGQTATGSVRA